MSQTDKIKNSSFASNGTAHAQNTKDVASTNKQINSSKPGASLQCSQSQSIISIDQKSILSVDSEGFRRPKAALKKMRRNAKSVIGKNQPSGTFRGAPVPPKELFVYRVDNSTDTDDLRDYITDMGIDVIDLKCISHQEALFKSFKLAFSNEHFNDLLKEDAWPDGVRVRRFIPPRQKPKNENYSDTLQLCSYNSHGSSFDRLLYIQEIFDDCDILLIQEHWLHKGNLDIYKSVLKHCEIHGTSGMNQNEVLIGRPFGETAILWKSNLKFSVTPIEMSNCHVCGINIKVGHLHYLLFNAYMPCDGSLKAHSFHRPHNTSNVDYTFESKSNGEKSWIDHLFVSDILKERTRQYNTRHDGHNTSDHLPLFLTFDIISQKEDNTSNKVSFEPKPLWAVASAGNISCYRSDLDKVLSEWTLPHSLLHCEDATCVKPDHITDINNLHDYIIHAHISSSSANIPLSRKPPQRNILAGMTMLNLTVKEQFSGTTSGRVRILHTRAQLQTYAVQQELNTTGL